MKSFILIAVLAALTVCNDAASIPEESALKEDEDFVYLKDIDMYQEGDIRPRDIVLHLHMCNVPGIPGVVLREDVSYRGNSTTVITNLLYNRVPAHMEVGPLGNTHLTIRLTSAPGAGIFTTLQFHGHFTDWDWFQ